MNSDTRTRAAAALLALAALACGEAAEPDATRADAPVAPAPTALPDGAPTGLGELEPEAAGELRLPGGFAVAPFVQGLTAPTSLAFAPDGRLFVGEQLGTVRVVEDGELRPEPFLALDVVHGNERGLLGLVLDPGFAHNGHLYVYYIRAHGEGFVGRASRFTASTSDPNRADPASEVVLLDEIPAARWHNAGALRFGRDGFLYVGIGEGGTDHVPGGGPQGLDNLNGKLLRLDVSSLPYAIPRDNPFAERPDARGEIYAWGLRNPFGVAIDPVDGRIWTNDVGEDAWEEVDVIEPGRNYGWPLHEGASQADGFAAPLYTYPHTRGCAATGAVFYRGAQFPAEYHGSYFFVDYCRRWIRRITPDGALHEFSVHPDGFGLVALTVGPDGALYFLTNAYDTSTGKPGTPQGGQGAVQRIGYAGEPAPSAAR